MTDRTHKGRSSLRGRVLSAFRIGAFASLAAGCASLFAGTATYDFSTDPIADGVLIVGGDGSNAQPWQETGGNPGGFLAVTYAQNSTFTDMVFPDIDPGKIVTAFKFDADLRVGNSVGDRAADGFSVNFARSTDPVLQGLPDDPTALNTMANFAGGIAEGGTTTGIAVCFDTWSGNTLPDGGDVEGIIVRVDNVTVLRKDLPTRHGACNDPTSLQTGPRDPAYWSTGAADPYLPESWATLCWQHLSVELGEDAKLTVTWKGTTVLDHFQTSFFPSAGRLVLAGRTGNANEHTHFDNISLTTTAVAPGQKPPAPTGFKSTSTGARRVALAWDASTSRVSYEITRNGTLLQTGLLTTNNFADLNASPGTSTTYELRAVDVAGTKSDPVSLTVTTPSETSGLIAQIYDGFSGAAVTDLEAMFQDPKFPNSPDRTRYVAGISFGEESNFGNTYGENLGVRIAGTLTVPSNGDYRFFVRSDDASELYLSPTAALPDPNLQQAIATESDCCDAFQEPGVANDDGATFPTSEPVTLQAGTQYGFVYIVKEGGGGDWGQVAMRKEGDTTPAAQLSPIRPPFVKLAGDTTGASITINSQPQAVSTVANERAEFTVDAKAVSPYGTFTYYQWLKNGQPIPNATKTNYVIPVLTTADTGAKYSVLVGTYGTNTTSSEATLTVAADTKNPTIKSIVPDDSFTTLTVTFSEPVTDTALTAANYTLSGGATVSSATRVDQFTVKLTTSKLTEDTSYTLTAANVADNAGNKVTAPNNTGTFKSWALVAGAVRADQFTTSSDGNAFTGAALTDMDTVLSDPKYPNSPDVVRYLSNGLTYGEPAFGDTWGENYMAALRGVLKPAASGSYRFFVRSDDASRLYINTSGASIPDALTATPVAIEAGCCGAFEEVGAGDNGDGTFPTSEPISLTAGQSYGVLYLVKEGGGGDWGQVAMRKEGDTTAAASLTPIKDQIFWYGPAAVTPPTDATISIARDSTGVKITYTGVLQSATSVAGPYTAVTGATSPYTVTTSGAAMFFRTAGQ